MITARPPLDLRIAVSVRGVPVSFVCLLSCVCLVVLSICCELCCEDPAVCVCRWLGRSLSAPYNKFIKDRTTRSQKSYYKVHSPLYSVRSLIGHEHCIVRNVVAGKVQRIGTTTSGRCGRRCIDFRREESMALGTAHVIQEPRHCFLDHAGRRFGWTCLWRLPNLKILGSLRRQTSGPLD